MCAKAQQPHCETASLAESSAEQVKLGGEKTRAEQRREEQRIERDDVPKEKSGAERSVGT